MYIAVSMIIKWYVRVVGRISCGKSNHSNTTTKIMKPTRKTFVANGKSVRHVSHSTEWLNIILFHCLVCTVRVHITLSYVLGFYSESEQIPSRPVRKAIFFSSREYVCTRSLCIHCTQYPVTSIHEKHVSEASVFIPSCYNISVHSIKQKYTVKLNLAHDQQNDQHNARPAQITAQSVCRHISPTYIFRMENCGAFG